MTSSFDTAAVEYLRQMRLSSSKSRADRLVAETNHEADRYYEIVLFGSADELVGLMKSLAEKATDEFDSQCVVSGTLCDISGREEVWPEVRKRLIAEGQRKIVGWINEFELGG